MKKVNSSKSRKVRETKTEYRVDVRKESDMTLLEQIQNRFVSDALIAATVLFHNLTLATRNASDFNWIEALALIDPLDK
jgi:predicted nucleic acid-binding protein